MTLYTCACRDLPPRSLESFHGAERDGWLICSWCMKPLIPPVQSKRQETEVVATAWGVVEISAGDAEGD